MSLAGDQVSLLALPLTAVLVLHASAVQMGILVALGGLPSVLFGLVAGAWIDRRARRPILLAADIGRFALLATIPLIDAIGHLTIGALYGITFLVGLLTMSFEVANRSLLPSLIPRDRLIDANSKLELSRSASAIAGPALAGGLVQVLTAPLAIAFDSLSFLVSAALLKTIEVEEDSAARLPEDGRLWAEVRDGIRFVAAHPLIRAIFVTSGTLSLFNCMLEAVFLLYLTRSLGLSAAVIGLVAAAGNVGFLVGAIAAPLSRRLGAGLSLMGGVALLSLGDLSVPLLRRSTPALIMLLAGAHFLFGLGLTLYNVNQVSIRQSFTPDRYLGRMNAGYSFLVSGIGPLGALIGGGLGTLLGLRVALVVSASGELASLLWLMASPFRSLAPPGEYAEPAEASDASQSS